MMNVGGMDVDDDDGGIEDLIAVILNLMKRRCSGLGLNNIHGAQLWVQRGSLKERRGGKARRSVAHCTGWT